MPGRDFNSRRRQRRRRRVTPLKFYRKVNKNSLPRDLDFESRSVDGRRVLRRAVYVVFPRRMPSTVATHTRPRAHARAAQDRHRMGDVVEPLRNSEERYIQVVY
jgi:hypothetical protein